LKPQYVTTTSSLTIEIYGGYREIGGNCVVIKDRDRKIVFDNGIRFSVFKMYYRGRVRPLGLNELRSLGAIPPLEVLENADAVYISHFHLDHLGLLGSLPPGVRVYVPSTKVLEVVEEWYRASPTWLAELPHRLHIDIREMRAYEEDGLGVTPVPVSHSAYPSFALIYRGHDKTLFYSGDLRVNGPLGFRVETLSNIERVVNESHIDVALIEGTNVGGVETPIGAEEFKSIMNKLLMENELVVLSVDPLDFEMLTAVSELATFNGRTLVIASPRIMDVVPLWLDAFQPTSDLNLAIATELEKPALFPAQFVSLRHDILKNPAGYLLVQEPLGFLDMIRQMRLWNEALPARTAAVLTTPEPLEAEAEAEEEALSAWLYSLGVQVYRVRLSGHYYPYEFARIVNVVRPQKLIPIHTRYPKLMLELYTSLKT
jgi:ribonuclease J